MIVSGLLALTLTSAASDHGVGQDDCRALIVPARREAVAAERLRGLDASSGLCTILERLGAPARDIGSGVYLLQWDIDDGRVLSVSTSGDSAQPLLAFKLRPAAASTHSKP